VVLVALEQQVKGTTAVLQAVLTIRAQVVAQVVLELAEMVLKMVVVDTHG
jgi:hypothetical protein